MTNQDYAFIYAKIARHVAAADALFNYDTREAGKELEAAMKAIATFETISITITTDNHD